MATNNNGWKNIKDIVKFLEENSEGWKISKDSENILYDQLAFSVFADTKIIYTEDEKESLKNIVLKFMTYKNETREAVCVSLICRYERMDENSNKAFLTPLFRFKKLSEQDNYFLDQNMQVHDTWGDSDDVYICGGFAACHCINGKKNNTSICFPVGNVNENYNFISMDLVNDDKNAPTVDELKQSFENITSKDLSNSWQMAQKLARLLFLQHLINSDFVSNIINNLRTQVNEDVFDALLTGYRKVSGEVREDLGNAYFIKDIQHILHYSNSFEKIKICADSKLNITGVLILNAIAFVQVTEDEKMYILDNENNQSKFKETLTSYRFHSEKALMEKRNIIRENLERLNIILLNDPDLLSNLKPHQVIRLYTILNETCKKFNQTIINFGIDIGNKLSIERFEQLDAVLEYGAALITSKSSEIEQEDNEKSNVARKKIKEINELFKQSKITEEEKKQRIKEAKPNPSYDNLKKEQIRQIRFDRAAEALRQDIDTLCNSFKQRADEYISYSKNEILKFADPMLAVSHYEKHAKDYREQDDTEAELSFEMYLQIAKEMLSKNNISFTWCQNGRLKRYEVKSKDSLAARYDNIIVTLMFM